MRNLITILCVLFTLNLMAQSPYYNNRVGVTTLFEGYSNTNEHNVDAGVGITYYANGLQLSLIGYTNKAIGLSANAMLPLDESDGFDRSKRNSYSLGVMFGFEYGKDFNERKKRFFDCETEQYYIFADDFAIWSIAPTAQYHVTEDLFVQIQVGGKYLTAFDHNEVQLFSRLNVIYFINFDR